MTHFSNFRVAAIATDGVEEAELLEPIKALLTSGAHVDILSLKPGQIRAFRHLEAAAHVDVDKTIETVRSSDYDGLLLPGGTVNADTLRVDPHVQDFAREFEDAGKPVAAICHAPWILISAGLVRGRTLTSYHTIADDVRNAGGNWVDDAVVVDSNWVTSRQPSDIPRFNEAMLNLFEHAVACHH